MKPSILYYWYVLKDTQPQRVGACKQWLKAAIVATLTSEPNPVQRLCLFFHPGWEMFQILHRVSLHWKVTCLKWQTWLWNARVSVAEFRFRRGDGTFIEKSHCLWHTVCGGEPYWMRSSVWGQLTSVQAELLWNPNVIQLNGVHYFLFWTMVHSTFNHDTHLRIFSLSKAWCLMPLIPTPRSLCRPPYKAAKLLSSYRVTCLPLVANPVNAWTFGDQSALTRSQLLPTIAGKQRDKRRFFILPGSTLEGDVVRRYRHEPAG